MPGRRFGRGAIWFEGFRRGSVVNLFSRLSLGNRASVPYMLREAFKGILRVLRNPFSKPSAPTGRSQLVGMYLQQANHKDRYAPEYMKTRSRRNSKYSFKRERQ